MFKLAFLLDLEQRFRANTERFGERVSGHVGRSQDVLRGMASERFDTVYIDGLQAFVPGATPIPGIKFEAVVTSGSLNVKYSQNMLSVVNGANGSGAAVVYTAASGLASVNVVPKPNSGLTFPALDVQNANDPTSLIGFTSTAGANNTATLTMTDSPMTGTTSARDGAPGRGDALMTDKIDLKKNLRLYIVVQYADGSLYAVANWDWYANFYATMNQQFRGVTMIQPASKVDKIGNWILSNDNPKTAGPIYNGNVVYQ
jgi:hypothetical protein